MRRLLFICLGGALGTCARFLLATWAAQRYGSGFPRGTILINLIGSFLIAAIMELSLTTGAVPEDVRLFLTTGVMGGFTTYSSFNYESLSLARGGAWDLAALNIAVTLMGALVAGVLGVASVRVLLRLGAHLSS